MRGAFSAVPFTAAAKPSLHVLQRAFQPLDLLLDLLEPAVVVVANPATGLVGPAAASTLRCKLLRDFSGRVRRWTWRTPASATRPRFLRRHAVVEAKPYVLRTAPIKLLAIIPGQGFD